MLPILDLITYYIKLGDPLEVYKINETTLLIKRTTAEFIFINSSIEHFIDGRTLCKFKFTYQIMQK